MKHSLCRACSSARLAQVLDLGHLPLAGGFLTSWEQIPAERRYPLVIFVCCDCGLVQIVDPIDPGILFHQYFFASGTVGALVQHFKQYAQFIVGDLKARSVVEFGCNDGVLLEQLVKLGAAALGVDLSENISEKARAKGLEALTGAFDQAMAERILQQAGRVDIVTGSNCFAHNDRPDEILDAARLILKEDGFLCLEVMYAGDLASKLQWDTLYHEHLNVYSLGNLKTLLHRKGFGIVDVFHLPMHAGSLRVIASPNPDISPSERVAAMAETEAATRLNEEATWQAFGRTVTRTIAVVEHTMADIAKQGRIWAYGASGRAAMWLNACKMGYIESIVDASPLRAGTLMPGTHTPVVPPPALRKAKPDYLLVTAWNYIEEIRRKESWYPGVWVTPAPRFEFF